MKQPLELCDFVRHGIDHVFIRPHLRYDIIFEVRHILLHFFSGILNGFVEVFESFVCVIDQFPHINEFGFNKLKFLADIRKLSMRLIEFVLGALFMLHQLFFDRVNMFINVWNLLKSIQSSTCVILGLLNTLSVNYLLSFECPLLDSQ